MLKYDEILKAVNLLEAGQLVAFPTETVYGLGADALNEKAINRIFEAKKRPYNHPLIVHIAHLEWLETWAREVPPAAFALAKACWPGPLTLVLKKQPHVLDMVTGGQDTVAVRVPCHPMALLLLKNFKMGLGIVAPSANQFTRVSPTTAEGVREELGDQVAMILDGGSCTVGLESTILDLTQETPIILRPGTIRAETIESIIGMPVRTKSQDTPVTTRVPGMHHLHYAPVTKTRLIPTHALKEYLSQQRLPTAVMLYSAIPILPESNTKIEFTSMPKIHTEYGPKLYETLRTLDKQGFAEIVVEAVPEDTGWDVIRDRLTRACGR